MSSEQSFPLFIVDGFMQFESWRQCQTALQNIIQDGEGGQVTIQVQYNNYESWKDRNQAQMKLHRQLMKWAEAGRKAELAQEGFQTETETDLGNETG